jgi:putative endonuclease
MHYYVYILANKPNGSLYIGVTSNLENHVYQHKNGLFDGFTKKYNIKTLVYFEETNSILSALQREKQLKKWNRLWKIRLIEETNPVWCDLSSDWIPAYAGMTAEIRGDDSRNMRG